MGAKRTRVAAVQINPRILDKERNLGKCIESIHVAARMGASLIAFPECVLTGYYFSTREEALSVAETVPGRSSDAIASLCKELRLHTVVGLVEKSKGKLYNASILIGPGGVIGKHRKAHLPYTGLDRFVNHGDNPLSVYDTPAGRIGMNICFEARFPETARVMALKGAEIIVLPTNWPQGAEEVPEFVVNTRAYENRVYYVAVNRVGKERGFRFIGRSKVSDPRGRTLIEGSANREEILYSTLNISLARRKKVVVRRGVQELPLWEERKPELYSAITRQRLS